MFSYLLTLRWLCGNACSTPVLGLRSAIVLHVLSLLIAYTALLLSYGIRYLLKDHQGGVVFFWLDGSFLLLFFLVRP